VLIISDQNGEKLLKPVNRNKRYRQNKSGLVFFWFIEHFIEHHKSFTIILNWDSAQNTSQV